MMVLGVVIASSCKRDAAPAPAAPAPAVPAPAAPPAKAPEPEPKSAEPVKPAEPPAAAPAQIDASVAAQTPAQRGGELYANMCAVCHGPNGEGYKADQAPMLAQQDFLASVSDEFLRIAISRGRPGTTMSAWGTELGGPLRSPEVLALIAFMRTWQKQPALELDESPGTGTASRGEAIWKRECAECHGPNGKFIRLLNSELLQSASRGFLRNAIRKGRPPTPMLAFETKLGARGIEDVVAYLKTLPAQPRPAVANGPTMPPPIPLGPVPLNPRGPEPKEFQVYPSMTPVAVVAREYKRKARMAILDARAPSDYALDHVAGAVSVPFYDPSPYLAKLPKKAWIVCYCGCPHAESGALAMKLKAAGFEKVTVMDEGLWEWKEKGHPMKTGTKP
jgi:cytochrome c oxidase cbb3-type subunit 3/ubiquinol-cytochrome c reductase cytochrome c subunit